MPLATVNGIRQSSVLTGDSMPIDSGHLTAGCPGSSPRPGSNGRDTRMGSHGARDDLDQVLDALLQAVPPEQRDTMRAHLRAAHDPGQDTDSHATAHRLAVTPHHAGPEAAGAPSSAISALAPYPAITPENLAPIVADLVRTVLRRPPPGTSATPREAGRIPSVRRPREVRDRPMVRLSQVTPQPLRWLWPGYVPAGKLTVLDGDPGLGKSTLLGELAARISRGEPLPGADAALGSPRSVLLCSAEDDLLDTIRPRIDAAGGDPQHILAFLAVPDRTTSSRPLALPADLLLLEAMILYTAAALVILDPLDAYLRQGGRGPGQQTLRQTLTALNETAARTGAAIVVVRHLTKSRGTNPLYRGVGGIGIIGAARAGLLLTADPDDPDRRVLAVTKGNLSRPAPSLVFRLEDASGSGVARVVWEGESPWTATQLLQAQGTEEGDETLSAVAAARTWVREALATGPRPAREVRRDAAAAGIGYTTLTAARKAEGVTAHKERVVHGQWIWTLADTTGKESAPTDVQTL